MINLLSAEIIRDPYPTYNTLREESPSCIVGIDNQQVWLVSRYADVCSGLNNHHKFTARRKKEIYSPNFLDTRDQSDFYMANEDPPVYRELRSKISDPFSFTPVNELRPLIDHAASRLVDKIQQKDEIEFIRDFAYPLIGEITAHITGLDNIQSVDEIYHWIQAIERASIPNLSNKDAKEVKRKILEKRKLFFEAVQKPKHRSNRLFFEKIVSQSDLTHSLSAWQQVNIIELLIRSSFQSTGHMLAVSLAYLINHKDLASRLLNAPENIALFVSEAARLFPVSPFVVRHATEDITLHNETIPAGSTIYFSIAAANRDPRIFHKPDEIVLDRAKEETPVSFGHGPHICLGIHLAKLQLEIALTHLMPIVGSMKCPVENELQWIPTQLFRGLKALPITILTHQYREN